jgi:hypothetical protein
MSGNYDNDSRGSLIIYLRKILDNIHASLIAGKMNNPMLVLLD